MLPNAVRLLLFFIKLFGNSSTTTTTTTMSKKAKVEEDPVPEEEEEDVDVDVEEEEEEASSSSAAELAKVVEMEEYADFLADCHGFIERYSDKEKADIFLSSMNDGAFARFFYYQLYPFLD